MSEREELLLMHNKRNGKLVEVEIEAKEFCYYEGHYHTSRIELVLKSELTICSMNYLKAFSPSDSQSRDSFIKQLASMQIVGMKPVEVYDMSCAIQEKIDYIQAYLRTPSAVAKLLRKFSRKYNRNLSKDEVTINKLRFKFEIDSAKQKYDYKFISDELYFKPLLKDIVTDLEKLVKAINADKIFKDHIDSIESRHKKAILNKTF